MGGAGEMQVTSIETHGQLDAGWLAATDLQISELGDCSIQNSGC